jgi:outer membrane protein TolC
MKKFLVTWVVIVCLAATFFFLPDPAVAANDNSETLTIQQALNIAYSKNPSLRKSNLEVEKYQLLQEQAVKGVTWIPTGGLSDPSYQEIVNHYQQVTIGLDTAKKARDAQQQALTKDVISAYIKALKNYNEVQKLNLQFKNTESLVRIGGIARTVGSMSNHDYETADTGLAQLREALEAQKAAYDASVAELRSILGEADQWKPVLTSRAILNQYKREDLATEISRAIDASVLTLEAKSKYDLEKSKERWIIPNVTSEMKDVDLEVAGINYEQTKRDAKATIEGLYYGIDALEGQIQAAESALAIAQKDLEIAQLKYDIGAIPRYSMTGTDSLSAAEVAAETARMDLENLKADLAQMKAQFAYLTGQTPYDPGDWTIVD